MEDILKIVIPAFSGALLLLLGAWLNGGREHKKWLRDKRFDAYLRFRAVVDKQQRFETQRFREDPTRLVSADSRESALEALLAMTSAVDEVVLLGPKQVAEAAKNALSALVIASTDRRDGGEMQEEANMRVSLALSDFVRAARTELKIRT